ncbi:MAG: M56 family metallopeptidase [Vulcanimicrobiota bacterium]
MDSILLSSFKTMMNLTINFCFCTAIILIIIKVLNVRSPHLRYYLLVIPLLKLGYDGIKSFVSPAPLFTIPIDPAHMDLCFSVGLGSYGVTLWSLIFSCIIGQHIYSLGDIALSFLGDNMAVLLTTALISYSAYRIIRRYSAFARTKRELLDSSFSLPELKSHLHRILQNGKYDYLWWKPDILVSDAINTPLVMGVTSPLIMIPSSLYAQLSREELTLILEHEMSHIVRCDNLTNHLVTMLKDIFFFLIPLSYLIKMLNVERERICDMMATEEDEVKALTFSRALLKVASNTLRHDGAMLQHGLQSATLFKLDRNELTMRVKDMLTSSGHRKGIFYNRFAYIVLTAFIFKMLIGISFFATSECIVTCTSAAMRIVVSA